MNFNFDNFSIVILAQAHNPSILNPDFLKNQNIVDPSFTPNNVICTPPVAQVSYNEGISIIAEFEKLQFIDTVTSRIPYESPIQEIAKKYTIALPHVRYTAVGLNFMGHYRCKDKESAMLFLPNKFLKQGNWSTYGDGLPNVGLKFMYSIKNVRCTITMDTTELIKPNEHPQPIVGITANYHLDSINMEEISSFISDWKTHYNHLSKIILDVFSEEE